MSPQQLLLATPGPLSPDCHPGRQPLPYPSHSLTGVGSIFAVRLTTLPYLRHELPLAFHMIQPAKLNPRETHTSQLPAGSPLQRPCTAETGRRQDTGRLCKYVITSFQRPSALTGNAEFLWSGPSSVLCNGTAKLSPFSTDIQPPCFAFTLHKQACLPPLRKNRSLDIHPHE